MLVVVGEKVNRRYHRRVFGFSRVYLFIFNFYREIKFNRPR